jgi:succinoglycan biosynthesis protein ExoA
MVWVMDGGSTDGTIDLERGMEAKDAQLHLFDNPGGSQSHAMNLAAQMAVDAGYRIMVRADAHCRYRAEFVQGMIGRLTDKAADSVTVPLIATRVAYTRWQLANGELQRSWLGNGGARHRQLGRSGWSDHGHHAAFLVDRFLAVGGYDINLRACEDVDYDHRQQAAGGRIWFAANWPVAYMPRANPRATWQQMLRNGRARMQVALKHRNQLNQRQLLPVVALVGLFGAPLGLIWWPAALPAMCYLALVMVLALRIGRKGGFTHSMRIAALAVTSHAGFGAGVLRGLMKRRTPV